MSLFTSRPRSAYGFLPLRGYGHYALDERGLHAGQR
jgi:hypothetical protein